MIIVSQDKCAIVNLDNILQIYITITIDEDDKGCYIQYEDCNNSYEGLGKYNTIERAKEVLQEIIKSYRYYRTAECDGYTNVLQETAVFEMPKD